MNSSHPKPGQHLSALPLAALILVVYVPFSHAQAEAPGKPAPAPQAGIVERPVTFTYQPAIGLGHEPGICRRDPSDVIKVGDTWYVWYSRVTHKDKIYPSGYNASVWYATSKDEGHTWTEKMEAVGLSKDGFDSFGVFTPNILVAGGKYHLFYTAVAKGFTNKGYSDIERTAIGLAVADSPDGPWQKVDDNPVLTSTKDPKKFDSFRVDDACFIVRDGKYWLYYKGRQWENTPGHTEMGIAVAAKPEGPYQRINHGQSVQDSGHEVMVWPLGEGVMSLVSAVGPKGRTVQYAPDGLDFRVLYKTGNYPMAPGAFRADLSGNPAYNEGVTWGISMRHGQNPHLVRYEMPKLKIPATEGK
jgi:hypothetical protein